MNSSAASQSSETRILVVEDDPDLNDAIVEMLRDAGYGVHSALDVEGARRAMGEEPGPALIVLDHLLRGETSVVLLEEMLLLGGRSPAVLVLTGSPQGSDVASAYGLPSLAKPFDLDDFLRAVERAARLRPRPSKPLD